MINVFFLSAHSIRNYAYVITRTSVVICTILYLYEVPVLVQVTQDSFFPKLNSVYSELICHQLHDEFCQFSE